MLILALSSSTKAGSIALVDNGQLIGTRVCLEPRRHAEFFNPAIKDLLQATSVKVKNLGGIAIDIGPGSFTGIRTTLAITKSFSFLYSLPILQVSSLNILGLQTKGPHLALVSAFRNLYYWAVVQEDTFLSSPAAQPLTEIAAQIHKERPQGINIIGDTEGLEPGIFTENYPCFQMSPKADILGAYAARADKTLWTLDWKIVAPLYLRDSEAEEKIKKAKPQ